MNLNEDGLYIKTIALDMICNFVDEKFLNWNCLESKNIVVISYILKLEI
jgi:hypothetical protein